MSNSISTEVSTKAGLSLAINAAGRRGEEDQLFQPVERFAQTTRTTGPDQKTGTALDGAKKLPKTFDPPIARVKIPGDVDANSVPIEIWEGTVIEVDTHAGSMQVLLDAKVGQMPRHTGEIDLEWVDDQDRDLVVPGAVFYLTLFKRSKPSIENAQELRFRRRPSWSVSQLRQVEEDAAAFLSKIGSLPTAI